MTDEEWHTGTNSAELFDFVHWRGSVRQRRLFHVACCRRVLPEVPFTVATHAVELNERFADGLATVGEHRQAEAALMALADNFVPSLERMSRKRQSSQRFVTRLSYMRAAMGTYSLHTEIVHLLGDDPLLTEVGSALLRCIFGNPFRPVTFAEAWRSETAVSLAAGVYADRAFDRLPILADALEEAGCDSADVLTHCRSPGPHARGCWVVDGVLGKG